MQFNWKEAEYNISIIKGKRTHGTIEQLQDKKEILGLRRDIYEVKKLIYQSVNIEMS